MARAEASGQVRVRHLGKTDYETVSQIYSESIREYLSSLRKAGEDLELAARAHQLTLILPLGEVEFYSEVGCSFVALSREKVVGFILAQPVRWMSPGNRTLWLEYIAVTRAFRRKGVGSALLSSVKEWGTRESIGCMFTTLNPNNEASRALLRRAGFEVREWLTASYPPS
jgi:RimJ/RimL family protein N-acetyltransferase